MAELFFDLHNLLRIRVSSPPSWLRDMLVRKLGHFLVPEGAPSGAEDIHLHPLSPAGLRFPREILLHSPYHMAVGRYRESTGIALGWHETELLYIPGRPIHLLFTDEARLQGRLYLLLLFALNQGLRNKGTLLLHGAVAVREEHCVLLCGLRGSGKSQVFLELLGNGWDYLADDKCILAGAEAMLFQPFIGITDFHLQSRPSLRSCLGWRERVLFAPPLRMLRSVLYRLAAPNLRRWFDLLSERRLRPAAQIHAERLFPKARQVYRKRITALFLLEPGPSLTVEARGAEDAIRRTAAVQSLLFAAMSPFEKMLAFCPEGGLAADRDLLLASLKGIDAIYAVTIPFKTPARAVYEAIAPCCGPV